MDLTPRLLKLAQTVPAGLRFTDIGTDHAYLPIWLLQQGKVKHAIATDLRAGPLDIARKNAQRFGLSDQISFRLCDGLSGVKPEETDIVTIAGMGGETIAAILGASCWAGRGKHLFLLQPMSSIPELRSWLQGHHFSIQKESIAAEGRKLYVIMAVKPGTTPPLSNGERWAGRQSPGMEEPLRGAYLEDLERRVDIAMSELAKSASPGLAQKKSELSQLAQELRDMKREWLAWQR